MTAPRVSIERIRQVVADKYGVSVAELTGPRRDLKYVHPRHAAIHLACRLTPHSLNTIGRFFGSRDHSTIYHAHWKTSRQRTVDRDLDQRLRALEEALQPPQPRPTEVQLAFLIGPLFDRDPAIPEPTLCMLEAA
jgi:chromosomal replication initiator protein